MSSKRALRVWGEVRSTRKSVACLGGGETDAKGHIAFGFDVIVEADLEEISPSGEDFGDLAIFVVVGAVIVFGEEFALGIKEGAKGVLVSVGAHRKLPTFGELEGIVVGSVRWIKGTVEGCVGLEGGGGKCICKEAVGTDFAVDGDLERVETCGEDLCEHTVLVGAAVIVFCDVFAVVVEEIAYGVDTAFGAKGKDGGLGEREEVPVGLAFVFEYGGDGLSDADLGDGEGAALHPEATAFLALDTHTKFVLPGHQKATDLAIKAVGGAFVVVAVDGSLFIEREFCAKEFADSVKRAVSFKDDGLWFVDVDQKDAVVSEFDRAD